MTMTNYSLQKNKNLNVDEFTSDRGIKIRRFIYPLMNAIIKMANGKKCILVSYPELVDNENYIFAAGHSFPGDIGSNLSVIDRSTYTLVGTTYQVDHNPQMNFLWANGLIYVNKLDRESRKESYKKMVRVLNAGTSVMLFPEGVLNNTENLDCVTLYPGVYHLALETGKMVVPIVANYNVEDNVVLIAAADPLVFEGKSKVDAKKELRDTLATLRFNLSRMTTKQAKELNKVLTPKEFLNFNSELKPELNRGSLTGDIHQQYLELRKKIYGEVVWPKNQPHVWDEEIMSYQEPGVYNFDEVYSFIKNINFEEFDFNKLDDLIKLKLLAPILVEMQRIEKYDVKTYMKKSWSK